MVRFIDVTTRPVTPQNAAALLPEALRTLHFSPEPRVIKKVIESAALLGNDQVVTEQRVRFKAAFPREYRAWDQNNRRADDGATPDADEARAD